MTLLTAKQHRILAVNLVKRAQSNNSVPPGKMRLLQMAENHITMAKMIEARTFQACDQLSAFRNVLNV